MSDIFLLIAMPYTALIVMLVGSVYVYRTQAYKVTSLSTQFLESRDRRIRTCARSGIYFD